MGRDENITTTFGSPGSITGSFGDLNHLPLKAEVVAINGTFSGSVQEIRCASGGLEGAVADFCILSKCSFGTHGEPSIQDYASEIIIEAGNPLKGPISSFTVKNAGSPAIVYYYDKA